MLKALRPQQAGPGVVLFGLGHPLGPKHTVYEDRSGKPSGAAARPKSIKPLRKTVWVYWEDLYYNAGFEHPTRLVLVDDKTGRVTVNRPLTMPPLIDGRTAPFFAPAGYYGSRFVVYRAVRSTSAEFGSPVRLSSLQRLAVTAQATVVPAVTAELANDCLLVIGDQGPDQRFFKNAIKPMQDALRHYGLTRQYWVMSGAVHLVPAGNNPQLQETPPDGSDLRKAAHDLATGHGVKKCADIMILIAGHGGQAAPGSTIVGRTSAEGKLTEYVVTPADVAGLLSDNPETQFKIKIDSCFSGNFVDALKGKHPNMLVLETSANHEPSWFRGPAYGWEGRGEWIEDPPPPPNYKDLPDTFTAQNLAGWEAFATDPQKVADAQQAGGGLLPWMLADGFALGMSANGPAVKKISEPKLVTNLPQPNTTGGGGNTPGGTGTNTGPSPLGAAITSPTSDPAFVGDDAPQLPVQGSASGGTPPYQFSWTTNPSSTTLFGAHQTLTLPGAIDLQNGRYGVQYTLHVQDSQGKTASAAWNAIVACNTTKQTTGDIGGGTQSLFQACGKINTNGVSPASVQFTPMGNQFNGNFNVFETQLGAPCSASPTQITCQPPKTFFENPLGFVGGIFSMLNALASGQGMRIEVFDGQNHSLGFITVQLP